MAKIEFEAGGIEVEAAIVAEGLRIEPSLVQEQMREGTITSLCERGIDDDAGRYRLTFFSGNRRLRLLVDDMGNVVQRSSVDFKFTLRDEPWFCFAGLWNPGTSGKADAFTLLTTAPGPDVAPIHSRQMVVLKREDWKHWLDLSKPERDLLNALPAGSLTVEQVR